MKDKLRQVNKAIQKQVKKDLWKEAKGLVELAPEKKLDELIKLHEEDNGNIFCLCLDGIKFYLWKDKKIRKKDFPSFGEPFTSINRK